MKRRLSLLLLLPLLMTSMFFVSSVPAAAAATEKSCAQYDGQYRDGDPEIQEVQKAGCVREKFCTVKADRDNPKNINISCKGADNQNGGGSNGSSGGGTKDEGITTISDPALQEGSCNKSQCDLIARYVNPTINLLTILVGIAIVVGIIIGAIQVMTSAGDPQQAARGKNHIRSALIAAVGYVLLYAFLRFIIPRGL